VPDARQRYDFPTRGLVTKAGRWRYPGGHPNGLARLPKRGWASLLVVAGYQGERYLVPMLGERPGWGRNLRAAGRRAVLRHGRHQAVRLEQVDPTAVALGAAAVPLIAKPIRRVAERHLGR
jgi:hypothetical protein